ncbi:MAG: glycosyltransferase family 9 protein [Bacteriovoracia bacterium]
MIASNKTPVEGKKPIRCLVIQLARLGDTLQSLMALRAAKQLYPELEIHFIARGKFAAAVRRVPWIESVVELDTEALLGPILEQKRAPAEGVQMLAQWLGPLVRSPWDFVVNWSYSEASSYLTALIPANVKLGYSRRRDTSFQCADDWSHYVQAIVQGKIDQNIHLTDILTTQLLTALQIHFGDPLDRGNEPVTSKGFFNLEPTTSEFEWNWKYSSRKWLAIQLGAGAQKKIWPMRRWAAFAVQLLKRHPDYSLVILGGKEDQGRATRFLKRVQQAYPNTDRIVSLVGKTSFDLWASVVSRCQWVVAGDTAVIHLASVLGTRVFNLSIGPVRWVETGPYGNGHYVIAPTDRGITAEAAYAGWSYAASEWSHQRSKSLEAHFDQLGWSAHLKSCRIFRSRIRPTTEGGGVLFEPLIKRAFRVDDWSSIVMGQIARAWYCGWLAPVGQELSRDRIDSDLIAQLRGLDEGSQILSKVCDEAMGTAMLLAERSAKLKSERLMNLEDKRVLNELGGKLKELDALIERLANTQAPLKAFSQMSKVMMHNLNGSRVAELGKESADAYRKLGEGVKIFRDWLKHTIKLAKPMAVVRGAKVASRRSEIEEEV